MNHVDSAPRLESLDQFRGYTVVGMLLVNFVSSYSATVWWLKFTHTYCSYHDTIMPQFFFAVGFAFRLTMERRVEREGAIAAYGKAVRRSLGLILIGFVVYHLDGVFPTWQALCDAIQQDGLGAFLHRLIKRTFFQTLVHIGVTSLWVLPVITASSWVRAAFLILSAASHVLLSHLGYFDYAWQPPNVIDGGPLGFLSWTIPLLAGSFACDWMTHRPVGRPVRTMVAWALVFMLAGYALSCIGPATRAWTSGGAGDWWAPPPFVPPGTDTPRDPWMMSQRAGTVSYLAFATGFSLLVFALFVILCDRKKWTLSLFRTFGQNALAAYIIHDLVMGAVKPLVPRDAPGWYVTAGFLAYFAITYAFVRYLEKNRIYLKL